MQHPGSEIARIQPTQTETNIPTLPLEGLSSRSWRAVMPPPHMQRTARPETPGRLHRGTEGEERLGEKGGKSVHDQNGRGNPFGLIGEADSERFG